MHITKRNGTQELYNVEKIHKVLNWAVDGIQNVSISDIEMNSNLRLYDGISTKDIHSLLIKSATDLISEECVNYQQVASRLLLYSLRKDVWGESDPPRLYDHIYQCIKDGIYDDEIIGIYSESEIHKLGKYIKHKRDENYTAAGLQQMIDKYLIKNRNTGRIYETPQFAHMLISMVAFGKYDSSVRLEYVKKAYDYLSSFKISLPTPILAGLRSKIRQFASCCLFDVGDSLNSIFANVSAVGHYTAKRAGIGINVGRIRPVNSPIRGGEVIHTGIIPYLKVFESTAKSTTQNGIRGGSITCYIPVFHTEIEDVVVLKNNSGTDDNRVRKLDYCVQLSRIFYQRIIEDKHITLFSPDECKDLYDAFGHEEFDALYEKYEKRKDLQFKKKVSARELIELIARERLETGRIYIMNIDHANSHSSFNESCKMSNLCVEVIQPTTPIQDLNDPKGEIGVCILSAVNLLETKKEEFGDVCDIIVRILDEIIDYQQYPVVAAEKFCKSRRSLGVGFTNLAALFAFNDINPDSKEALELVDEYSELLQFSLLRASCNLARDKSPCEKFDKTKYYNGIMPYHTYKKDVDKLIPLTLRLDWESLEKDIQLFGLRHSSVTCEMPCESSSVSQNSTNGIELVRDLIIYKKSKMGVLKQVVPGYQKYGDNYVKAFDIRDNSVITNIVAIMQRYFDMSISMNHYYNYDHYEGGNIPLSVVVKDILYAYKMGIKTIYYANTPDGDQEAACPGGACSI